RGKKGERWWENEKKEGNEMDKMAEMKGKKILSEIKRGDKRRVE
ncbi:UNVERIFIED_CONTAM: 1,4-beta-N-acetylmuramidase, partial [Lacticaseibacillus paracasei]|nr:1,4-beta-N-acetylmuramidase [Lacticaseibacillus paracasei]